MTTIIPSAQKTKIIYPESDGKRMADNTKQFELIVKIEGSIGALLSNNPHVFIAGDLLWYPVEGEPKICAAPDIMVVFGRPKGHRGSYKQWEEDNIAPQVVFEILSPSNTQTEMAKKLIFYDRHGVEEYYLYDPDRVELVGWIRQHNRLEVIEDMTNWISPRLGIRFDMSGEELEIFDPDGERFITYVELAQARQQERQRADLEKILAEQEKQRAEQEKQRAEQAEAKLAQQEERIKQLLAQLGQNDMEQ
ncbi:MAG TPA: Uma2 family endonuclease [Allocoleopsis sp.]